MAKRQTEPGLTSEWSGFHSAAVAAIPLATIGSLVETATQLAEPDSQGAPDGVEDLTELAKSLAPPDTPVGGGPGDTVAEDWAPPETPVGGGVDDSSITADGVRLGSGAEHAIEPTSHANAAAELVMAEVGDELFLTTVGVNNLPDAVL